jgi:hypothetical protein
MTPLHTTPTGRISGPEIDRLAWKISTDGFGSIPTSVLKELGFEARQAGVHVAMTETLTDPSSPLVVRQRIFGQIAHRLAEWRRPNDVTGHGACAA